MYNLSNDRHGHSLRQFRLHIEDGFLGRNLFGIFGEDEDSPAG